MAPRITILKLYAEARGLDPQALERAHIRYLETFQYWILERLELLSYGVDGVEAEPLRPRRNEVAAAVDAVLEALRSKPEDAAALPPLLTLPEKLVVVEATAPRLREALWRGKAEGVWRSWLYVLHLATPDGRPTCLGRAFYEALTAGREPGTAYVEAAERLDILKWIVALEAAALDVGTKNELDALLAAYARHVPGPDLHAVYYAFRYLASDVKGITMAVLAEPPEKIFALLESDYLKDDKFRCGMSKKQKLKFYDIKAKKAFETDNYEVVEKQTARGPMMFAVATSPHTGKKVYRLLGRKK